MGIAINYVIIEMYENHPNWQRVLAVAASLGEVEVKRLTMQEEHFLFSHVLAGLVDSQPVGYSRFVVQRIGEDDERLLVKFNDQVLEEAKVITFAVVPEFQNRGIGRALQQAGLARARELGCYQFNSRSNFHSEANHHLKISMGFGIQPSLQDDSLYFIWPLQAKERDTFDM